MTLSINIYFRLFVFALPLFLSCRKFITVSPPATQLVSATVFSDDATATSAMTGIYSKMIQSGMSSGDNLSVTLLTGLSSDELINYSTNGAQAEFYQNALTPPNSDIQSMWSTAYKFIYSANAVLEGLDGSSSVTTSVKNQLTGEAKFIRAFMHFYLVNLFGDVPLVLTTNYSANTALARSKVTSVYAQIIKDLTDAQSLLSYDYSFSNGERTRPNKAAATALLSRVYLYSGDWVDAASQASTVISDASDYQLVIDLNSVFLMNSSEAIWQLAPVKPNLNTNEGYEFILKNPPTNVSLQPALAQAFEPGDNRATQWINFLVAGADTFYYPFKYKIKTAPAVSEYSMVLRLAEQYLIRAEARVKQGDLADAMVDLNTVRNRAGLPPISATDQQSLLSAIAHERKVELFCEWGHRWLDLKRTGMADAVLTPIKGSNWQTTDILFPIPLNQLQNDPEMTQNAGY